MLFARKPTCCGNVVEISITKGTLWKYEAVHANLFFNKHATAAGKNENRNDSTLVLFFLNALQGYLVEIVTSNRE